MKTLVLTDSLEDLQTAAELIRRGELVAFPTETVYGLGANGLNEQAVKKIFAAKGRPQDNPLILHIADKRDFYKLAAGVPASARTLLERFCPGPLTLVLPKAAGIPDAVTAGLDSVAVRMPVHSVARTLIELAGVPIAAPSANISGRPSPTCAQDVLDDLDGKIAAVVQVQSENIGLESTVLDCTCVPPRLLRPGGVTAEMLGAAIGVLSLDEAIDTELAVATPKSPGMKYKHYAPQAKMCVLEDMSHEEMAQWLQTKVCGAENKVGLLLQRELAEKISLNGVEIITWETQQELANILYTSLRSFDRQNVGCIYAQGVPAKGLGLAIMNRMRKSAGFNIIKGSKK